MSDKEKSLQETAWEKVLNEITDPGDWVAAGAGAAIGGIVALITHWPDLFTIVATGAIAGVTIRKAWAAARLRPQLRRRSRALDKLFKQIHYPTDPPPPLPSPNLDPGCCFRCFNERLRFGKRGLFLTNSSPDSSMNWSIVTA